MIFHLNKILAIQKHFFDDITSLRRAKTIHATRTMLLLSLNRILLK